MSQDDADKAIQTVKRKLSNARRELRRAVERSAEVDLLAGHRAEALRRARDVRDAADAAVRFFELDRRSGR